MSWAEVRIIGLLILYGAGAVAAQTLLVRQGILWAGGNELALGALFFFWFSGIALGAFAAKKIRPPESSFTYLAGLFPMAVLMVAAVSVFLQAQFPPQAGIVPSFGRGLFHGVWLMVPTGAWIGFTFPAASLSARGIARAFLWESLGSAMGGLAVTLLLVLHCGAFLLLAGMAALGSLALPRAAKIVAVIPLAGMLTLGGTWDALKWKGLNLAGRPVAQIESPVQSVALAREGESTILYLSGRYAGQFPDPERTALRYRPFLAQGAQVHRVALVGGFPFESEAGLLCPGVEDLVILQPDPYLYRTAERFRAAPPDWRAHYLLLDPRIYFNSAGESFDLILLDAGAPVSILANRLFTLEFFESVRRRLAPGGACVVFLPASENYWGREMDRSSRSVHETLRTVFPWILMSVGENPAFIASGISGAISDEPMVLERRARERGVEDASFSSSLYAALFPKERLAYFRKELESRPGPVNRDRNPFGYLFNLAVQEKVNGQLPIVGTLLDIPKWSLWVLLLPVACFLPMRRRGLFQVFSTGFLGIGVFLILSIAYQTAHGTFYSILGVLTGLFMLGLSASAPAAEWLYRRNAPAFLPDAAALLLLVGVGLLRQPPAGVYYSAIFLSGAVLGLPFTFVGLRRGNDGAAAAQMEWMDHLGAAVGALLSGLFLLPFLGIGGTLIAFAGLKLISAFMNV